jgi:hypothetical protein
VNVKLGVPANATATDDCTSTYSRTVETLLGDRLTLLVTGPLVDAVKVSVPPTPVVAAGKLMAVLVVPPPPSVVEVEDAPMVAVVVDAGVMGVDGA